MKRNFLYIVAVLIFAFSTVSTTTGTELPKPKKRWKLDFQYNTPKYFTYTSEADIPHSFWYMKYTVTNNSGYDIPINLMLCLKTNYDVYHLDNIDKKAEELIIIKLENMEGLPRTIALEKIEKLKQAGKYLNMFEMNWVSSKTNLEDGRKKVTTKNRVLKNGNSVTGLALFSNVDPRFKDVEIRVYGLFDVLRYKWEKNYFLDGYDNKKIPDYKYIYESRIFSIKYYKTKGQFQVQYSRLRLILDKWEIKPFGFEEDITLVENLIDTLSTNDPILRKIAFRLLKRVIDRKEVLTSSDPKLKYKPLLSPNTKENKYTILLWKEWWFKNQDYIYYDSKTRTFKIKAKEDKD